MATYEGYGATCPNCGYTRMMFIHGTHGWFVYDACPKCGLAYGTNHQNYEEWGEKLWKSILRMDREALERAGFSISLQGLYEWMESLPEPDKEDCTFDWSKVSEEDMKRFIWLGEWNIS